MQVTEAIPTLQQTAPLTRRLISLVYESLLLGAVIVVFFLLPQTLLGVFAGVATPPGGLMAHFFLLLLVYFCWFWLHGGQTLAMKTWRVCLTDISGKPLRPMQAVLRYCGAWASIGLGGLGLLWALVDQDKQFLHDRIAGTRLVELPRPAEITKTKPTKTPTTF